MRSPNYDSRPFDANISVLVLHYTGMQTADAALARLSDPAAQVSAHYVVEEDGNIHALVPEEKRAWHAGISCWRGRAAINDISIGIEMVNPGHEWGYRSFPEAQMQAILALAKAIQARHNIPARNVVGHSDIAPHRKSDPGELFDWKRLSQEGIGLWPETREVHTPRHVLLKKGDQRKEVAQMQQMLAEYGYHLRVDGVFGENTEAIVKAFKRHFVPEQLSSEWDMLSQARIAKLLTML